MKTHPVNVLYFDEKYKNNPDPWQFASSTYELDRYEHIYKALSHKQYNLIFEAGCSIGILTKKLSTLASFVTAIDISPTAVSIANQYCSQLNNVSIHCASLTDIHLDKKTDLLILSEIGYYFFAHEWKEIVMNLLSHCAPKTTILASHWLGFSAEHVLSGDEVHNIIQSVDGLHCEYKERNPLFRLERWIKS